MRVFTGTHDGDLKQLLDDYLAVSHNSDGTPSVSRPYPTGNRATAIGDSIMLGTLGTISPISLPAESFFGQALVLTNQRMQLADCSAVSGTTTAQMLATQLPAVIASTARPTVCVVMGGTNDPGGSLTAAQSMANLTAIYNGLLNAGIVPIAATVPPRTGQEGPIAKLNAQILRYCARNGIHCADLWSSLVNPVNGRFAAAYDAGDGIHPNAAGAKVAGQLFSTNIVPLLAVNTPFLSGYNSDPNLGLANSCLLTDTNADGIPDNWNLAVGSASTYTLAADAVNVLGNAWTITRAGVDVAFQSTAINGSVGDRYAFGCKMKFVVAATAATADLRMFGTQQGDTLVRPIRAWGADMAWQTVYCEGTLTTGNTSAKMQLFLQTGNGNMSIAQPTFINLTANGLI